VFEVSLLMIGLAESDGLLIVTLFSDLTKFALESGQLVFPGLPELLRPMMLVLL